MAEKGKEQNGPPHRRGGPASSYLKGPSHLSSCLVFIGLNITDFGFFSGPMRPEAAFVLPQHTTETEELKPQLRLLLSHFNIPYDVEELRGAAKETELFFLVLDGLFLNLNIGIRERQH